MWLDVHLDLKGIFFESHQIMEHRSARNSADTEFDTIVEPGYLVDGGMRESRILFLAVRSSLVLQIIERCDHHGP
jgi:hypothetical protein